MQKVSRAELLRSLPEGAELTLVRTSVRGEVNQVRTVVSATQRELCLRMPNGGLAYVPFAAGDVIEQDAGGFKITNAQGISIEFSRRSLVGKSWSPDFGLGPGPATVGVVTGG